jgi:uncharacterized protein YceK
MKNIVLICLITFALLSYGCGTMVTISDNKQWPSQIYAGTGAAAQGHGTQIDVPFSLVADTLFLPYTIPRTIYNYTHIDTLFYEYKLNRLKYEIEILGVSVLVIYSSTNDKSNILWPNLLIFANQKKHHLGFSVFSLDRSNKDAANLISKYNLPPFLLYRLVDWDPGQLKLALESLGMHVEEPINLPIIAVFDSKRNLLKQWYGIQDLAEVEKVLDSIYSH